MTVHELTTWRTCEQVEARDTAEQPLAWRIEESDLQRYREGDGVTLTSSDGAVFIGAIDEMDEDAGRMYVVLS